MTDQNAFGAAQPIAWPRAAVGAVISLALMAFLFVAVPNQFVTSDPSNLMMIITIAYVVVLFAVVGWVGVVWQNRGSAARRPVSQKVSAFGRPMREGPGFASIAERATSIPQSRPIRGKGVGHEVSGDVSSFGRPVKERSK